MSALDQHHRILIVGGGTAGISVAARLAAAVKDDRRHRARGKHYYQPLWTLVGGGRLPQGSRRTRRGRVHPPGATWIRDAVAEFRPGRNRVLTRDGRSIGYDYLVVAPGIQIDWDRIHGLRRASAAAEFAATTTTTRVDYTWECIRGFDGRQGAVHEAEHGRSSAAARPRRSCTWPTTTSASGRARRAKVIYASRRGRSSPVPTGTPGRSNGVAAGKGIETLFEARPRRGATRAKDGRLTGRPTRDEGGRRALRMIHVTPPMSAPDLIKRAPWPTGQLVRLGGRGQVHPAARPYPNVFGLGDASDLPTSKTGAAIRKQAPVVVGT